MPKCLNARCVDQLNVNFAKVNYLCDKACTDISETSCDPNIIAVFTLLCDAAKVVSSSQGELTKLIENQGSQPTPPPPPRSEQGLSFTTPGAIPKCHKPDSVPILGQKLLPPSQPKSSFTPANLTSGPARDPDPDTVALRKFKDAVHEAEKSTVIFNLEMGNFPLLNTTTISKKATLAMTSMAAKVEKRTDNSPSREAITAIDDVLSIAKNMTLFGNATKPYNNKQDPFSWQILYCALQIRV
jgi:hypothetical protein